MQNKQKLIDEFKNVYNTEFNRIIGSINTDGLDDLDITRKFSNDVAEKLTEITKGIIEKNMKVDETLTGYSIYWLMVYFNHDKAVDGRVKLWRKNAYAKYLNKIKLENIAIVVDSHGQYVCEGDLFRESLDGYGYVYTVDILTEIAKKLPMIYGIDLTIIDEKGNIIDKQDEYTYGIEKYQELNKKFGDYTVRYYPMPDKHLDRLFELVNSPKLESKITSLSGGGKLNSCTIKWVDMGNDVKFGFPVVLGDNYTPRLYAYKDMVIDDLNHINNDSDVDVKKVATLILENLIDSPTETEKNICRTADFINYVLEERQEKGLIDWYDTDKLFWK